MKAPAATLYWGMDSRIDHEANGFDVGSLDLAGLNLPPFRERSPWHGGDLQTLRNFLARRPVDLSAFTARRIELPLNDGSGDRLFAYWHTPPRPRGRPLVVLIHGLTGYEDSVYLRATSAHLLAAGFPVLRLNLRGAGPSRGLCRLYYHAGRSEDVVAALAALPNAALDHGAVAVGYSLGGNVLLKYLGEAGKRAAIAAAVTVSAPLDLVASSRRLMARRNAAYQWYFVNELKRETLTRGAELTAAERRAVITAQSLWDFDDGFTAPRNGFADAEEYYARCSSANFLDRIAVPTLLLHAADDPIVPAASYRSRDWGRNRRLTLLLQRKGGHVGFHDRRGGAWHDRAISRFFERVLNLS